MNRSRAHTVARHVSMPLSFAGVAAVAFAIAGNRSAFGKVGLVLFVLAAGTEFAAYLTRTRPDHNADRLVVRQDETDFVALVLAATLAVESLIWLVTYASDVVPFEVTLAAISMAFFVIASMAWAAHLARQLRQRVRRPSRVAAARTIAHHTS